MSGSIKASLGVLLQRDLLVENGFDTQHKRKRNQSLMIFFFHYLKWTPITLLLFITLYTYLAFEQIKQQPQINTKHFWKTRERMKFLFVHIFDGYHPSGEFLRSFRLNHHFYKTYSGLSSAQIYVLIIKRCMLIFAPYS